MLDRFLRSHHVFPADSALALEVRALRRGDPPAAARHFQEVCAPAPRKAHTGCYTGIDDEGWGIFCAQRDFGGLANHRASAKQAAASLRGGIYGYETWARRGRWSDTSSADTIGRMPTGSLIAPADLAAAADLAQELGALRELPLAPYATRTESTANYRRPNAIHAGGAPSLPQNAIFADWAHWRDQRAAERRPGRGDRPVGPGANAARRRRLDRQGPGVDKDFTKPYSVAYTAYIDAIENDSDADLKPETNIPLGSRYHVNIYQDKLSLLQGLHGVFIPASQVNVNVYLEVWSFRLNHTAIDDHPGVKHTVKAHLLNRDKANVPR